MITIRGGRDLEVRKWRHLTGTRKSSADSAALTLQILLCRSQSFFSSSSSGLLIFPVVLCCLHVNGPFFDLTPSPLRASACSVCFCPQASGWKALHVWLRPRVDLSPFGWRCERRSLSPTLSRGDILYWCLSGGGLPQQSWPSVHRIPPTHSEKDEMPQSLYDGLTAPVGLSAFGPCAKVWNKRFCFCFWAFIQMSIDFSASLARQTPCLVGKTVQGASS